MKAKLFHHTKCCWTWMRENLTGKRLAELAIVAIMREALAQIWHHPP